MTEIRGLFPPIPTPFEGGRVSAARLSANIARWLDEPLDGFVVLGSNGEAPLLTEEEKRDVVHTARRAIPEGDKLMIVGTGRESTAAAIRATREAFDMGADAVLLGAPHYYKPMYSDAVLEAHYRAVADASPGPILLYSVPQFTGVPLSPDLVRALAPHPRIVGLKDSGSDIERIRVQIEAGRSSAGPFSVLIGTARLWAEGLIAGAVGGVVAVGCVAPRVLARIAEAVRRGDLDGARALNEELRPLAAAVTTGHGIGGLKAALDLLGYHGGEPRPPLPRPSAAAREEIAARLRDLGLLS